MDFRLKEEQKMLKEMVRRLAKENFASKAAEIDEKECFPEEILRFWQKMVFLASRFLKNTPERVLACFR